MSKAQKGLEQCNEEIEKLKQTDLSRQEKTEAAIAKLEQEKTHEEELIRHGIRAKKTASLEDEDRIQELKTEVGVMCEENAQRIEKEAEEDRQRQEERRIAQERFEERLKVKQAEQRAREEDKKDQDEGENRLKQSLKDKELQFQERARQIKFEEDDDHSRIEHQLEVVGKKAEKFNEQVNIEGEEIRDLSAKVDARRIALANEKKAERRLSVAEHEADLLMEVREKEEVAVPVIDQSRPTLPDLEPTLPKQLDPKPV